MDELKVFENEEFGSIRTVVVDDNSYFVGKDVAEILGYSNTRKALIDHVDEDDKMDGVTIRDSIGREQTPIFINESGLYSLVLSSKLPTAKKFKRWVTSEVLPSIRKNGGYIANQEQLTPEQIVANALVVAQNILAQKEKQIEIMAPKAEFYDAICSSQKAISMNEVAKAIGIKRYGRNKILELLRNDGVLDRKNIPYQKYLNNGWFKVIEQKYEVNGEPLVALRTLAYQKGVDGIRKKILKRIGEVQDAKVESM